MQVSGSRRAGYDTQHTTMANLYPKSFQVPVSDESNPPRTASSFVPPPPPRNRQELLAQRQAELQDKQDQLHSQYRRLQEMPANAAPAGPPYVRPYRN
jgi:hypothetical protein